MVLVISVFVKDAFVVNFMYKTTHIAKNITNTMGKIMTIAKLESLSTVPLLNMLDPDEEEGAGAGPGAGTLSAAAMQYAADVDVTGMTT